MANSRNGGDGVTLIALYPILYHAHQYKIGDELPVNDASMVSAWINAGTAKWKDATEDESKAVKAVPKTAEPGRSGKAVSTETDGDDLVGKVPKTKARKK